MLLSYAPLVVLTITFDREEDGRIIASVDDLPGVHVYGETRYEAARKAVALAVEVLLDQVEHGERPPLTSLEIVGLGEAGAAA
jgi:predicted RNase H-like HicB family nuclease